MGDLKVLIVGQGLGGSCMALELHKRGCQVKIISESHKNSSSHIAAGLFNPIALKKLNPAWKSFETYLASKKFYSYWEEQLKVKFFFSQGLLKVILNEDEKREWIRKSSLLNYFLEESVLDNPYKEFWHNYQGYGLVKEAGYIHTDIFLDEAFNFFKEKSQLIESKFHENEVTFIEEKVVFNGEIFDSIILCEGFYSQRSSFFDEPFSKAVKGEILLLDIPNYKPPFIISKGAYLVPTSNGLYKLGATYNWDDLTNEKTEEGLTLLKKELTELITKPYTIIEQLAGVRPASIDRKPVLGRSKQNKNVYIFNGLGTRGVMLAPWMANNLADAILLNEPIDKECDIERFRKEKYLKYIKN